MDERLLDLYNTELRHLRETAGEFAREFPKIAGRLAIDPDAKESCPDPYVERLLEGFAFLAARVHLKLDSEYPRFTQGLLETVYPDYLCPVPSMAIARFEPEEQEASLAQGFVLPRGTLLRSQLAKGERTACTFSTAHAVRLLPLSVIEARYYTRDIAELKLPSNVPARAALRIRLRKTIANAFKEIKADPLVFHLRGEGELANQIYEQIFAHKARLMIQAAPHNKQAPHVFGPECIRRVGFKDSEALLPPSPRGFEGYRLLREYFAFPPRFLFFELADFQQAFEKMPGDEIDIVIALKEPDERLTARVDKTAFELFCTPIVNLFEKTLDRVQVSEKFSEFHVVPDRNRPLDFEIYQISAVTGYGETPDQERVFHSFYHARDTDLESSAYYSLQRVPRLFSDRERLTRRRSSYAGTDVYISIVDADMAPYRPELNELGVRAWCTNRHLPIQMAKGIGQTDFTMEVSGPIQSTRILQGPTLPRPSVVLAGQNADSPHIPSGRYAWRVISHLSLNYLSLQDSPDGQGAEALRELLKIYSDPRDREMLKQIDGLRGVAYRPILRRIETPGPITFGRGMEISVLFDENSFEGQGVFVLGAVLEQFFARVRVVEFIHGDGDYHTAKKGDHAMAGADGQAADSLMKRLGASPEMFDFFAAVRRIQSHFAALPRIGRSIAPAQDPVRFGQSPFLEFAPSTLEAVKFREDKPPAVYSRHFGVFGPNGPLPLCLTEYARDRILHHGDKTFAAFCNVFHHRLLSFFFRAWADARKVVDYDRPSDQAWPNFVGAIPGLGMNSLLQKDSVPDRAKFYYAGRLASQTRNAEGLEAIVGDFFGVRTELQTFVGRWLTLPPDSICKLGESRQTGSLGLSTIVGSRVWTCQMTFRLRMGPMKLEALKRLLPSSPGSRRLVDWVKFYCGGEFIWEAQIVLAKEEVPAAQLGRGAQLGWTTWLKTQAFQKDSEDLVLSFGT